jgi:TP901 family phage tail tape measure protein
LGTRIGVAFVSLTTDNSGLRRGFGEAQTEAAAWARKYGTTVGSGLAQSSRQLQAIGTTITRRISLPLALAGGAATSYAAKFQQAMSQTVALSNVAANQLGRYTDTVKALAEETGQDAVEVAHALYFVGSAGLKTSQVLPVLTLSAKAATAGLGSVSDIGQVLTSVLNAYHGTAVTAAKATDALVEGIRQGKAEPAEFAQFLGSVIPVASQLSISVDQVIAALATATNYGVDTARAATGLRYALVNLEKPTDKAKEVMANYGLSMGQVQKSLADPSVGLLGTFQMLADTFDITTVKGLEAFQTVIGGTRAAILVNTLVGDNLKRNQSIFEDVAAAYAKGGDDIGKAYDIMRQTPAVQFQIAWNKIKLAAIDAGGAILPIAEKIITMVGDAAEAFAHFPAPLQSSIVGIGLFLVALGPVATGLGLIGRAIAVIAARSAGVFNMLAGNTIKAVGPTEALVAANTALEGSTALLTASIDQLALAIGTTLPAASLRGAESLAGLSGAEAATVARNEAAVGGMAATKSGLLVPAGLAGGAGTAGAGLTAEEAAAAALAAAGPEAGISAAGVGAIFAAIAAGVYVVSRAYNRLSFDAADAAGAAGLTVNQVKALEDQYNRSAVQLNPFGSTGDKVQEAGDIYKTVLEEAVKAGIPLEVAQRKLNAGWAEAVDQIGGLTGSMPAFRQQLESTLGLAESPEADAFRSLIADMNPINAPGQPFGGQTLGPNGFPVAQGPTGKPVSPQDQFALSDTFIEGLLPPAQPTTRGVYGGRGGTAADTGAANTALAAERANLIAVTDGVNASIQAHEDLTDIVKTLGFAVSKGVITWDAYYAILKQIGADVPLAKLGDWGKLIRETAGGTDKQRASLAGLVTQMQAQGVHIAPLTERLVRSALASKDWALAIARLAQGLKTAGHDALVQHADDLTKAQIAAIKAKFANDDFAGGIRLLNRDLKQLDRKHDVKVDAKTGNTRKQINDLSSQLGKVEGEHDLRVNLVDRQALRGLRNLKKIIDDILAARSVDVDIRRNNAPTGELPVMSPQVVAAYRDLEGKLESARQKANDLGHTIEEQHRVDVDVTKAQADLAAFVRAWSNGRIVIGVDVNPGGPGGGPTVPTVGGHHHHAPVHDPSPHQQIHGGGFVRRMHSGGSVWGDDVPTILQTEEFVTRAPIARRNENYLRYLNRHGRPPESGGQRGNDDAVMRLAASHQAQIDDVSSAVRELAHAIAKGGVHMDGHKVGTLLKREDRRRMGL